MRRRDPTLSRAASSYHHREPARYLDHIAVLVNSSDLRFAAAFEDVLECGGRDDEIYCGHIGRDEVACKIERDLEAGSRCTWGWDRGRDDDASGASKQCLARGATEVDDDYVARFDTVVRTAALCARANVTDDDEAALVLTNASGASATFYRAGAPPLFVRFSERAAGGGAGNYTLALASRPRAPVVVDVRIVEQSVYDDDSVSHLVLRKRDRRFVFSDDLVDWAVPRQVGRRGSFARPFSG